MAAAAWSWVEKMLHDAQRTSAPSSARVSISTAVWIVMWSEPVIRAPLSGLRRAKLLAQRHQARHLGLGDLDFLAAEIGEAEVLHDKVVETGFSLRRHVEILQLHWWAPSQRGSRQPLAAPRPKSKYKGFFIC